jgi:sarcosine oxidase subunit beta
LFVITRESTFPNTKTTDCIVVGAGLIGLSTALHLRWRGLSVRVVERGRVGDGTSSRASGWVCAQLRTPNELLALVLASLAYFPEFLRRLGDECQYAVCGSLVVFDSDEQLEQRRLLDAEQRHIAAYAGAQFLSEREVHELEPALADHIGAGSYFADDAHVDPRRLLDAMLIAARRDGVVVHEGAAVESTRRDGGWSVTTPVGRFDADNVVNASGAWAPAVAELAGLELPVLPVAGQLLVTQPRPGLVRACVVSQPDPRFAGRSACGVRPAADGRLWLGTTYRGGSFDTTITADDTRTILAGAENVFPGLRGIEVEQAWAGVRPVPADLLPIYGAVPGVGGYYAAVPVAGLAESAIAGQLVAELVVDGESAIPSAAALSPDRFTESD